MIRFLAAAVFLNIFAGASWAQEANPPPPPPPPNPPVNLNSRTFLNTSSVFDPIYGLGKFGIVKEGTVEFLPPNGEYTPPEAEEIRPKGFKTYDYTYSSSAGGEIKIPVVGGFSISSEQILHVMMEDISEVYLKERKTPAVCEIWKNIRPELVQAGSTIIYTDHAVFSTLEWGAGSKAVAGGEIGIGSYFSASGGVYKDAASMLKVPLIAVDGVKFTVANPTTFCTETDQSEKVLTRFNRLEDLGLTQGSTFQLF